MVDLLIIAIKAFLTFVVNSIFLILYFSTLISYSSKLTLHRDTFKIALPGTFLISFFIFFDPWLPRFFSFGPLSSPINVGISSSMILWTVLTRHYCETDWISAITLSFVATIMYTFTMLFVYLFLFLATKLVLV